jgi:MFS family permease
MAADASEPTVVLVTTAAVVDQSSGRALASLRIPSFRWWFLAQILSGSGGMAQAVGQAWLVLKLTHSGLDLGLLSTATFGPVLLAGAWAGALLDHVDVRKTLIATQVAAGVFALALAVLVTTGSVRVWMVFALAVANGIVFAIDQPARQLYVVNLVGRDRIASAVGLYEVIINASRLIGPATGALMLATAGVAACFYINAASFIPPFLVLLAFRSARRERGERPAKPPMWAAMREGVRYVRRSPAIAACLVMAVAAGMVFNLGTALPVLASRTFGFGGAGYGALMSCFGIGAIPGGFAAAYSKGDGVGRKVRVLCLLTGLAVLAVAMAPRGAAAFPLIALVGFFSIWMIALANTLVQLRSDSDMRGRVMGLWTMALPGLGPITGIVVGATSQYAGPREGYGLAGVALAAAAILGWRALSE